MIYYKKITLSFQSGYVTALESDTILGYIFAYCFSDLAHIFKKFQSGNAPFLISNGFREGILAKPYRQLKMSPNSNEKTLSNNEKLFRDMKNEIDRKDTKGLQEIPCKLEFLKRYFDGLEKSQLDIKKHNTNINIAFGKIHEDGKKNELYTSKYVENIDMKNFIPRFDSGDTEPYALDEIKRFDGNYSIFVKIFEGGEQDFEQFYVCMEKVLTSIGRGKYKSKGYGQIKNIKNGVLNNEEKEVFDFLDNQKRQGTYYILNNYKPSPEDIEHLVLEQSFYQIHYKHATSGDNTQNPFKGTMHFFTPGSVLQFKKDYEPTGDVYVSLGDNHDKYNFGFIF